MEAYLGPNKTATLATGESEDGAEYAVVKFLRDGDPTAGIWVDSFAHYGPAVSAVNQHTTHRHYAVLCSVRPALVPAVTK